MAPNTKLVQACHTITTIPIKKNPRLILKVGRLVFQAFRESHQVFLSWRGKLKMNLAPQPVLLVGDLWPHLQPLVKILEAAWGVICLQPWLLQVRKPQKIGCSLKSTMWLCLNEGSWILTGQKSIDVIKISAFAFLNFIMLMYEIIK